jgi:hypothetical protein
MADQVGTGTPGDGVAPLGAAAADGPAHETFHGRAVSWVAVSIIMTGFVVGGVGLVAGPAWWAFWTGAALAAVGCLLALATNIFEDWY